MPELPEVETVANGVHERTQGQTIVSVWTSGKPQTFKTAPEEIAAVLTGARIERVRRVGKTIVCDVTRADGAGAQFLVHLGMTGRLLVSTPETPVPAHTHAILGLSGGREVRFVDARRFGRLSIHRGVGEEDGAGKKRAGKAASGAEAQAGEGGTAGAGAGYTGPGREPLTISLEDFIGLFRGRKTAIKAALLNQTLLHGVGNIYADESLYRAGIRPTRRAGRLTRAELGRLREELVVVLRHAIELGGSSVSDYVDAEGVRGFFQLEHMVYGRAGEDCKRCGTGMKKTVVGGRTTVYCPKCQG
jgi:formamidopyrimidine-DNA glycosylase